MKIYVLGFLCLLSLALGCGKDRLSGGGRLCASLASLSPEARALGARIEALESGMFSPGSAQWWAGDEIVVQIVKLPQEERAKLATAYMSEVERLGMADVAQHRLVVWLYNYQDLLKTVAACMPYLEDQEWVFRQYAFCADRYKRELEKVRQARAAESDRETCRKFDQIFRDLTTDYGMLSLFVRNIYLPCVGERRLSPERYQYWKQELEGKIK